MPLNLLQARVGEKFRSLQMLRALAAILVVLFHTQDIFVPFSRHIPFDGLFSAGYRGVDLFFVLSGFIIAHVHGGDLGHPKRLPNYVFNRLTRVYPAVWVLSALALGLYALGYGGADKLAKLAPDSVAASALLLPQHGDALVSVTWTLTYEMFFYTIFAVCIFHRGAGLTLLLLWQVCTVAIALSRPEPGLAGYYLRSNCLEFGIGLVCAWLIQRPSFAMRASTGVMLIVVGIVSFVTGMAFNRGPIAGVLCALGAGAMIVSLVELERASLLAIPDFAVRLGDASYSVYLVHFSVIALLAHAFVTNNVMVSDALFLFCAAAGVGAGVFFDHTVDKSIRQWFGRWKISFALRSPAERSGGPP